MFALRFLGVLPKDFFPLIRNDQKILQKRSFSLHLVTHRASVKPEEFLSRVMESVKGGITHVQLRDDNRDIQKSVESAIELKEKLKPFNVRLIVNNRIDVALVSNADGVHLGQKDFPWEKARKLLKKEIIGLTVHTWDQLMDAQKVNVDYLGIQLLPSKITKKGTHSWGMDCVPKIVKFSKHNIVFIGGIVLENMQTILRHLRPQDGIAMAGDLWRGKDPYNTAKKIQALFKEWNREGIQ